MLLLILLMAGITSLAAPPEESDPNQQESRQDSARIQALAEALDLEGLEKLAPELEKKWFAKDKTYYGYMMLRVCGTFTSCTFTSRAFNNNRQYELARQYALLALDKSQGPDKADRIPIEVEFWLLMYVREGALSSDKYLQTLAQKDDWANERSKESKFYFQAWARLESSIDPNWDPNDPSLVFPRPPAGVERGWSWMSPEDIEDPKLRAEYEAALNEYWQKVALYQGQRSLRQVKKEDLPRLQNRLLILYSGPAFDSKNLETDALQQDLKKHIEDKKVRDLIFNGLKKRLTEESEPKPKPGLGPRGTTGRRSQ
jgi:hypothetical protein